MRIGAGPHESVICFFADQESAKRFPALVPRPAPSKRGVDDLPASRGGVSGRGFSFCPSDERMRL